MYIVVDNVLKMPVFERILRHRRQNAAHASVQKRLHTFHLALVHLVAVTHEEMIVFAFCLVLNAGQNR